MTVSEITILRLQNQHLTRPLLKTPADVVSILGAVQAQDYAMAKWALGLRMQYASDEIIEKAFNAGTILRTHVMRPTWHFVIPEDIRWLLELTAPRVKTLLAHYNRKLELDDVLLRKSNTAITNAILTCGYRTRQELKNTLAEIGITTHVQRLAHIIMWAELNQLICSGPRRGKQFTYALMDERAPKAKKIHREEALGRLAQKYFTSHGPAQIKDFAWWSGLSMKDATNGLELIKSTLNEQTVQGHTYYFPVTKNIKHTAPGAFLLSIFDEYAIAYKDRSALGGKHPVEKMISKGNAFTAVIIYEGTVIGTWKRILRGTTITIALHPFERLSVSETTAVEKAAYTYGKFLGLPVSIS